MKNGSFLALAWPETPAVKVGMWYDAISKAVGILKSNNLYPAGHAACAIVNNDTGEVFYFDFGRYQAPPKHGRIRGYQDDPELAMKAKLQFNEDGTPNNLHEILLELWGRKECHGQGALYASWYNGVDFELGFNRIIDRQKLGAIPYGPFELRGTNCSRFVSQSMIQAKAGFWAKVRLSLPFSLTPTPVGNVVVAARTSHFYIVDNHKVKKVKASLLKQIRHYALPALFSFHKNNKSNGS